MALSYSVLWLKGKSTSTCARNFFYTGDMNFYRVVTCLAIVVLVVSMLAEAFKIYLVVPKKGRRHGHHGGSSGWGWQPQKGWGWKGHEGHGHHGGGWGWQPQKGWGWKGHEGHGHHGGGWGWQPQKGWGWQPQKGWGWQPQKGWGWKGQEGHGHQQNHGWGWGKGYG